MQELLWKEKGFPHSSDGKESACNAEDQISIHGLGRPPGGVLGNPLQYFAWRIPWNLAGHSPWLHKESEMTKWLTHVKRKWTEATWANSLQDNKDFSLNNQKKLNSANQLNELRKRLWGPDENQSQTTFECESLSGEYSQTMIDFPYRAVR